MSMENQSKTAKTLPPCFKCKDGKDNCDNSCVLYDTWIKSELYGDEK